MMRNRSVTSGHRYGTTSAVKSKSVTSILLRRRSGCLRRDRAGQPEQGWYPEERISGLDVLRAYTEGPARASGEGYQRGRLSAGYVCDFAAWDTDLVTADPEKIRSAQVTLTVVGGEVVFDA